MRPRQPLSFYPCHISCTKSLYHEEDRRFHDLQGPIIEIENKIAETKDFTLQDNRRLVFKDLLFNEVDNSLLGGKVGLENSTELDLVMGDSFITESKQVFPNIFFLWNRSKQIIYIEKRVDNKIQSINKFNNNLEHIFSTILAPHNYIVSIGVKHKKGRFWEFVDDISARNLKIKQIRFSFIAPNLNGTTAESLRNLLVNLRDSNDMERTDVTIKVPQQGLDINRGQESIEGFEETTRNTGGQWEITDQSNNRYTSNKKTYDVKNTSISEIRNAAEAYDLIQLIGLE